MTSIAKLIGLGVASLGLIAAPVLAAPAAPAKADAAAPAKSTAKHHAGKRKHRSHHRAAKAKPAADAAATAK